MKTIFKTTLILTLMANLTLGCKKEGSSKNEEFSEKNKSSLNDPELTCAELLEQETNGLTIEQLAQSHDTDGDSRDISVFGTADEITKICDWEVCRHIGGMWYVYSHETIKFKKRVPKNTQNPYEMISITHTGSEIDTQLPGFSWNETSASEYLNGNVASMRIIGSVNFCTFSFNKSAYQIFTAGSSE